MDSKTIRSNFIRFFEGKQHKYIKSSPIVVKNDPTLMFTNAGMNQFKEYFLGNKIPDSRRVVNSQKCLRVSGKHNDLEEVGIDTYHHTMFEMLGNWSFGDYFKKEAIYWAWELLTEVYGLPKDRLYATVFEGDASDNLAMDDEAYDIWKEILDDDKVLKGDKEDNFWEMGDTGPCGPCSEIHLDLRPADEVAAQKGSSLVNADHPLVVEIWNLVFIQFNRLASGKLENLPEKHVDTGMGFERLAMAIQNKESNYDTDIFQPLIAHVSQKAGIAYGANQQTDIAIRVIVDHIRAIAFTIADGQLPSNNKAGYVIRRILRRAVRYGYTFLNFKSSFLPELLPILAQQFEDIFPEIKQQQDFIAKVIYEEEQSFLKTLEIGLKKIDQITGQAGNQVISGKTAFELYDTYGFPFDLTALIARERGFSVDEEGFHKEMAKQKERSKGAAAQEQSDWVVVQADEKGTEFLGYDYLETKAKILRYRELKEKDKTFYQLVLDQTPFYPEGGGQVGDTGVLSNEREKIEIFDTKKENELILHYTKKLPRELTATFSCYVHENKRRLTQNNHTATHLMHAALRQVLGDHVQQKGSLVNDQLLRFDFSHFSRMNDEEIREVEHIVNQKIRENIRREELRDIPFNEAREMGATALFGEKYGDNVRVIIFDSGYSVELCGGTHVTATGNIGFFKITQETAISAGVRRIEAVTADQAEKYVTDQLTVLESVKSTLKYPKDLKKAVDNLVDEKSKLAKEVEALQYREVETVKEKLWQGRKEINGIETIMDQVTLPNADLLKKLIFDLKSNKSNCLIVLAASVPGKDGEKKPQIAVAITEDLISAYNLNAGEMVKSLAKHIDGGGGGQAFYATAGGKNLNGLSNVLEDAKAWLTNLKVPH